MYCGMLASVVDVLVTLIDVFVDEGVEYMLENVVVVRLAKLVEKEELGVVGAVRLTFNSGIGLVEVIVDELNTAVVRVETVHREVDTFSALVWLNDTGVEAFVDKVDRVLEVL